MLGYAVVIYSKSLFQRSKYIKSNRSMQKQWHFRLVMPKICECTVQHKSAPFSYTFDMNDTVLQLKYMAKPVRDG